MTAGRRFQFQLTPLLDLLLIVIFAQYLDVQQQADVQSASAARQIDERRAELDARLADVGEELAAERARLAARTVEIETENTELRRRTQEVIDQQRRAADLTAELFRIPQKLIEDALKPLPADAPPRSTAEAERLRRRFAELAELRGSEVVEHLLTYEELRKRADVWSLRVGDAGDLRFTAGDRTQSFRAATSEQFADRLYERYKALPTPKGLVVLLVSYGDARADVRRAVISGLPEAIRQLRDDAQGRTQFEYAVLGFVPEAR